MRLSPRPLGPLTWIAAFVAAVNVGADVVVEVVPAGFGGERAGLAAGDVIASWSRPRSPTARAARGRIRTPFDLLHVEIEQGPRGSVRLIGRRDGHPARWDMPRDEWRLGARPPLSRRLSERYESARSASGDVGASWDEAVRTAEAQGDERLMGWLLLQAAAASARVKDWMRADAFHARAVTVLSRRGPSREASSALYSWAETLGWRAAWNDAAAKYEQALLMQRRLDGESLTAARLLRALGDAQFTDDAAALALYRQSLALRETLAPESGAVADSLSSLGRQAVFREDNVAAEQHLTRALRIRAAVMPDGQAAALDTSALGVVLLLRGDYAAASVYVTRALATLGRVAPASAEMGYALFTAGRIARGTGDLVAAEHYYRRALDVYGQLFPGGLSVGDSLRALSIVAWDRRDFAAAESRAREALAIMESRAPGSDYVSNLLHHLGDIALDRGALLGAEGYFRRALAVDQARGPDGLDVANHLRCLSLAVARSGRPSEAEASAARSVALRKRLAPNSLHLARSLTALAEIASLEGRLDLAEARYDEALAASRKWISGSREEADVHWGLGRVRRRAGHLTQAAESFRQAIDILERQRTRLGGTDESRNSFAAAYSPCYHEAIEVLVELGRHDEAFHVLERSRARLLLGLLAERDLLFPADLPPDVAGARRLNQAAYDRALEELSHLDPGADQAAIDQLVGRLLELRERSAEIRATVRGASSRLAALQEPEPFDSVTAAAALEPDTAFLGFSVGKEKTLLLGLGPAVAGERLTVVTIPIGEVALRERIQAFRSLIERGDEDDSILRSQAAELYDLLLRPLEGLLGTSRRLAISPDGPLHLLPFAALLHVDTSARPVSRRWLAEWKAIHIVSSVTHYAELKKVRRRAAPADIKLVAFGDPRRSELASGGSSPLPATRSEVEAIAALFGTRAVTHLGEQATEGRVKTGLEGFSHVHFACHGTLDEQFPLHSGLVLAPPEAITEGADNGLLQVWEIFEDVRVDADLVVLSACETGLGQDRGGEGLLGLTRAFQYAGARSVLASLWRVSDPATADLMVRFYGHLKNGRPTAEALQTVQVELILSGASASHPLHWAAFAAFGDWY
jgi:CHAT domain-containing protein